MGIMTFDISKLKELKANLENKEKVDKFFDELTRESAAILLTGLIELTPVVSGDLRRGWTGGVDKGAYEYAYSDAKLIHAGNSYTITISNGMKYAEYVNYGHRQEVGRFVPVLGKRLVKPWVEGQFMVEKSINQAENIYPSVVRRKAEEFIEGVFDV